MNGKCALKYFFKDFLETDYGTFTRELTIKFSYI